MSFYNVHYPDGTIKKHKTIEINYTPGLDKYFYNTNSTTGNVDFFSCIEMSEEDIWVEQISDIQYRKKLLDKSYIWFVEFHMNGMSLVEF